MAAARPTLRCLWSDLVDDLTGGGFLESHLRENRTTRRLPHPSLRLDGLQHPIMDDVRCFFTEEFAAHLRSGGQAPPARVLSLGQTKSGRNWGMTWYKARSDANCHLRGAVCLADDVFWLGWEADRNDDYASFNNRRNADQHTLFFEPTDDDSDRLALEDAWEQNAKDEQASAVWVIDAVLDSWDSGDPVVGRHPQRPINLIAEAESTDGEVADLVLRFEFEHTHDLEPCFGVATGALPGIDAGDWEPEFFGGARGFSIYTMVEPEYLDRLLSVREAYGSDAVASDPARAADPSDGRSHLVRSMDAERGYVDGALIKSLCGRRFVPTKDPSELEVCEVCAGVVHALGDAGAFP